MKRVFILFIMFLGCISTYAQHRESQQLLKRLQWNDEMLNIMVDSRLDFRTSISDNWTQEDMGFEAQTFKVWLVGEIKPGIRYRIRHRFNKPQTPLREGYSAATDQAWIAFDAGKDWTFTIGKQSVQFGTFEFDYNPADVYLPTMCFNDLDAYKTGVDVAYKFNNQVLHFQVINSDSPQFASEDYSAKALAGLLLWDGSLWDNTVKTRWSYGLFQHTKTKFYHWLTLGTQLNLGKFTAEADYYLGNRHIDYGEMVGISDLGDRYVNDESLSLNLKTILNEHWHPFIKVTYDKRHDQYLKKDAYATLGLQGVVEFYPFKEGVAKDLRFHFAYEYSNTDFNGSYDALGRKEVHTILVGSRWLFKAK
jgi:hypothetical protein